jgi:hypothetical protein
VTLLGFENQKQIQTNGESKSFGQFTIVFVAIATDLKHSGEN